MRREYGKPGNGSCRVTWSYSCFGRVMVGRYHLSKEPYISIEDVTMKWENSMIAVMIGHDVGACLFQFWEWSGDKITLYLGNSVPRRVW